MTSSSPGAITVYHDIPYILETVCKLTEADTLLKHLILEKVELLKQKGWVTEKA